MTIEVNHQNSMWRKGYIYVMENGQILEEIDLGDTGEGEDDILDMLKVKYNTENVRYIEDKFQK